jgi:glycosyltransferase involved in cell wall biosynthesis
MLDIKKDAVSGTSLIFSQAIKGKVSIIITNYKKERFLKKAILSCLGQSYENIEIIVIDDCSNKDVSLNIAKSIGSNKVRYLYSTRNYGHYACCNHAIDQATGEYVTFLGADDTIGRDHIKYLLIALKKYKLVGVCSLYTRYYEDGKKAGKSDRVCEASILFEKNRFLKDIGYFHMVRYAADTEYRMRAIKYYGSNKFGLLQINSYKALCLPDSLTSGKRKEGLPAVARAKYAKQFLRSLRESKSRNLYFNYKRDSLRFSLEKDIRVDNFDSETFGEVVL